MAEPMQGTLDSSPNPENQTKKHYSAQKVASFKGVIQGQGGFSELEESWTSSVGSCGHPTKQKKALEASGLSSV